MTTFDLNLNEVNVVTVNNRPIRCIPIEELWCNKGRSGDWHGWSYQVYKTKTGKLIAGFVSWSSVQGESDYLHTLLADNPKHLFEQLELENFVHRDLAEHIAKTEEVVATV